MKLRPSRVRFVRVPNSSSCEESRWQIRTCFRILTRVLQRRSSARSTTRAASSRFRGFSSELIKTRAYPTLLAEAAASNGTRVLACAGDASAPPTYISRKQLLMIRSCLCFHELESLDALIVNVRALRLLRQGPCEKALK